jgi:antitoxin (DNA-binding transcriptional repressor) of toxin-antitoxin stability system
MADHVIHISEADAARDFAGLLARVRAGAEVVIESGNLPVAVIHSPVPPRRSISECIALLPEDSTATIDADFAKDVEAAVESHREPLEPPACKGRPHSGRT